MNFIQSLQKENRELKSKLESRDNAISEFIGFLHTSKFCGVESNGDRKDWISTSDVCLRLREIVNQN